MTDAELLHNFRQSSGLSIRELAGYVGLHPRSIRRVLSGRVDLSPRARKLVVDKIREAGNGEG